MADADIVLHEPFRDAAQQKEADTLGMWVFLATELMLFGGLFMGALTLRVVFPEGTKEASRHMHLWLGGINTAVLLTSSLFMALAVVASRAGRRPDTVRNLAITTLLGVAFLGIKAFEYWEEYHEGLMPGVSPVFVLQEQGAELFFNLYYIATGLHAVHLTIGVSIVTMLTAMVWMRSIRLPQRQMMVEIMGLYWHLIDIIWIFLYPVLYLAR